MAETEERIRNLEQRLAQAEARIAQLESHPRGMFLPPLTWDPNTSAVPGTWTGFPPPTLNQEP